MGKKGKASSSNNNNKAPKCTCEDPYRCSCGNRPERPSRGHKWDPVAQAWGGKGHKQKGGSGQTSSVAQAAKVTSKGNTTLEQWQKLPSSLLKDVCQKEKRPPAKYKCLSSHGNKFQYRVIVQDAKASRRGGEHDLFFVPNQKVSNEEQAKEEAALLALLHLTPAIPHERKLPEPYKTTWIRALEVIKDSKSKKKKDDKEEGGEKEDSKPAAARTVPNSKQAKSAVAAKSSTNGGAASSSFNLVNANAYSSLSEKRKIKSQKQIERRKRLQRHEATKMANRDVQVFLSAAMRRQIETLLRGDADDDLLRALVEEDDDGSDGHGDGDEEVDDVQSCVMELLTREGFTRKQARAGYIAAVMSQPSVALKAAKERRSRGNGDEDEDGDVEYMEQCYEESLQWLCVHLDEDQLPEGFDPRGRTLDVILNNKSSAKISDSNGGNSDAGARENANDGIDVTADEVVIPEDIKSLQKEYGVSQEEAILLSRSKEGNASAAEEALWTALCKLNGIAVNQFQPPSSLSKDELDANMTIVTEEMEVLQAIFPEEEDLRIENVKQEGENDITQICMVLPNADFDAGDNEEDHRRIMRIQYHKGSYPMTHPRVFILGGWGSGKNNNGFGSGDGTAVHSKLVQFVADLPTQEPMIFEIFNYVQELLQEEEKGGHSGHESILLPFLKGGEEFIQKPSPSGATVSDKPPASSAPQQNRRQPTKGKRAPPGNSNSGYDGDVSTSRVQKRPRTKSAFWSKRPRETPAATAFPKLSTLIENQRKRLPAQKARQEFLDVMAEADGKDRVVLVTGETGCGKTTQIPQFILEEAPKDAKIVVAQPRRLAATGVAERVANERGEASPGVGSVGYVVRGEVKMCNCTRLMFCTTGVLLRQLQCEGALNAITHIVIDEVHERHLDTDILLAILKETRPPHLRVVLMSATMDADRFAAYWGADTPRMHIPGFTHPVKDYVLEDVLELTGYIPPKKGKKKKKFNNWNKNGSSGRKKTAWNDSELSDDDDGGDCHGENPAEDMGNSSTGSSFVPNIPIEDLVKRVNSSEIDYDMLAILVDKLVKTKAPDDDGSILVFLPGAPEIARAQETILKITRGVKMNILPLHGGLQPQQQKMVFDAANHGITKIILSTNVAETSITIPDCTIVVDTCREKQSSYDPSNRMPMLIEKFASRDSLKQRRGRAGRVRPGSCYKLISRQTLSKLPQHGEPEIKRCALDQTLLSLLFLGVERGCGNFLSKLIDPPTQMAIDAAIYSLEKVGALRSINSNDEKGATLTPLGLHLAGIPAPPVVGKMLVMGSLLGCRSAALAIAAGLSVGRSPFLKIMEVRDEESKEAYRNKIILGNRGELFETVGNSDHAMLAAVYMQWDELSGGGGVKRKYCESLGLSPNVMRDMKQLARQLDSSLSQAGFVHSQNSDIHLKSPRIIRSFIVSSLAPTQVVRVQRASTKYAETAEGAVEKDGKAKELKFYTRGSDDETDPALEAKNIIRFYHGVAEERVFIHPGSANFSVGHYSCPWLVYYQLVRTSKPFVRDVTECSNYDLLLFGGNVEVAAAEGLITVDKYVRMSANARIGALIGGLRRKVDDLLSKKIMNPNYEVAKSVEMTLIVKLLRTDGMGQ